jgi:Uma2 family endonuclease
MMLGNHFNNSPCLVLTSDIKLRLEAVNCYYYPDVAVTCDERDTNSTEDFILYPSLIIEVLSPSTAALIEVRNLLTIKRRHFYVNMC